MSDEKGQPPGHDWITVVHTSGTSAFAKAFSAKPVLDASVLNARCVGVEPIEALFEATRAIYDTLAFTSEAVVGPRTYLEWEARLFGEDVAGATILTRDEAGLIERVQVYHRPLHMVLRFSAELARHLNGKVDPNLFGPTERVGSQSADGGGGANLVWF